ncbi:hypothetical protein D915_004149 [Fasciola hepatica]|uniref:CCHC-type domain-containing protein n=1 Tax=Fasciola hepatica TaxID=6192 RepID=A0A4E0R822_FASHE|nr:hypothetical protein D915_004149 [Fasciola hepatica]
MAKVFLRLQPPKDLAILEPTNTTLDQKGGGMNVTTPGIFAVSAKTGRQPAVREVKVCYYCPKPGHIARYCRRRINREGRSTFHAGNFNSFEYDKRRGALPVIEIIINRHQVRALIDSGPVYSLISEQLASKVPRCPLYDRPVSLISVTGTPLEVIDSITTELQVGVHDYLQGFTVVRNLPVPVILGVEFLRSTRCTLNFRDNWLQTEGDDTRIKTQTASVTFMADLEEESASGQRISQLLPSEVEGPEPPDRTSDYVIQSRERLIRSHQLARQQLQAEHRRQKEYYDKSTYCSPLEPGDRVWLRSDQADPGLPAKLHRAWRGPYEVCEVLSASMCSTRSLRDPNRRPLTVNFDRLRPDTTAASSGNLRPRNVAVQ